MPFNIIWPVTNSILDRELITFQVGDTIGHDVVEDVIASLQLLLVGDPRFLQQVDLHVSPGELPTLVEVDTDELPLRKRIKRDVIWAVNT